MFFTYLWRELRRRARQAAFIAAGLALGIGLVITVTAASNGVQNSQASVLHTLYGVGTNLTVTEPPAQGSGGPTSISIRQQIKLGYKGATAPGSTLNVNELLTREYGLFSSHKLATVGRESGVTGAVGGLTLTDVTVTGKVPSLNVGAGGGSLGSNFDYNTFTVDGVDLAHPKLGPLSSATLTSGSTLTAADANSMTRWPTPATPRRTS
jgi:putative ABC transport system permease protein